MSAIRTALAVLFGITLLPLSAWADCSEIETIAKNDDHAHAIQLGLRAAFSDNDPRLADDELGAYSKDRLEQLCQEVPRQGELDDVESSIDLAREYAELETLYENWASTLLSPAFLERFAKEAADGLRSSTLALRIAGTPEMTASALDGSTVLFGCAETKMALADNSEAKSGLTKLLELFPEATSKDICNIFMPAGGKAAAFEDAMRRFGQLENALPGALQDLKSAEFAKWIHSKDARILLRLAGSGPAVLSLVNDFRTEVPTVSIADETCKPETAERTLVYYSLSTEDVNALQSLDPLKPILDDFRDKNSSFESASRLWQELEKALSPTLHGCVLGKIKNLITGSEDLARQFQLEESLAEEIDVNPGLQPVATALRKLLKSRTRTQADLEEGLRAALMRAMEAKAKVEVTEVANVIMVAAYNKVTAADDERELIAAVNEALNDEEYAGAFLGLQLASAGTPENVKGVLELALRKAARAQLEKEVSEQTKLLEPHFTSNWTITQALEDAISALPDVQLAMDAIDAPASLKKLTGIAYPSQRLFKVALQDQALDDLADRITVAAEKPVPEAHLKRDYGQLQTETCGCAPGRIKHGEIYGFYPFWFAPTAKEADAEASDQSDGEEERAESSAFKINFEITNRIAFYGLEFVPDKKTGHVLLHNERQWLDARRSFVSSAHRFRVKADLAFDLRGWINWSNDNIEDVTKEISAQMAPMRRFESDGFLKYLNAIPTPLDPMQPDGVTLIFHDYRGLGLTSSERKKMLDIIKDVYEALPNRKKLSVNVAFDFELVQRDFGKPLFNDLHDLLIEDEFVLAEDSTERGGGKKPEFKRETVKIIDKILLFLERPTTDTKKLLRSRMEQGDFRGGERFAAVHSIIPVVPPGGHQKVHARARETSAAEVKLRDYSQFDDDVVYFKDNFAGLGFWPVPLVAGDETADLEKIIEARLDRTSPLLVSYHVPFGDKICNVTCPNRAHIWLGATALFVVILLLTARSFFSGTAQWIAFGALFIGWVWIGYILLFTALLLLSICDPMAFWSYILMLGLLVTAVVFVVRNWIQRVQNGPMP